jgi:methionyl-tRNA formyltransferase
MIRIVYFGTSTFAVPPLLRLLDQPDRFEVVAVVSQPDRPVGRKAVLTPTPVSAAALERGVKLLRYEKLKPAEVAAELGAFHSDVFVTAAYGRIIPQHLLDLPGVAPLNLHGSLLPRHRGASPIQRAIKDGDAVTGVSLMKMDAEMDHGPVYATVETPIAADDTYTTLEAKLAHAASELLIEHLPRIVDGTLLPTEQDHAAATATGLIAKEDGRADLRAASAVELERTLRAYTPWPGLAIEWMTAEGTTELLKLVRVEVASAPELAPGAHGVTTDGFPAVGTREGTLVLREVQPAGKKPMDGKAFLNGNKDFVR